MATSPAAARRLSASPADGGGPLMPLNVKIPASRDAKEQRVVIGPAASAAINAAVGGVGGGATPQQRRAMSASLNASPAVATRAATPSDLLPPSSSQRVGGVGGGASSHLLSPIHHTNTTSDNINIINSSASPAHQSKREAADFAARLEAVGAAEARTDFIGREKDLSDAERNAGAFLKAGGGSGAPYFAKMFNPTGIMNLGGTKALIAAPNAAKAGGSGATTSAAESKEAATLLATLVASDAQRARAVAAYNEQVTQFLATEVSTIIADLYLVQAEVDVHYFQISRVLDEGERARKAAIAAGMAAAAARKSRGAGAGAAADGGGGGNSPSAAGISGGTSTDESNEAYKDLLKYKAKGTTELKATIRLILQTTTISGLEAAGTQAMRALLTSQIHEQQQIADGSHAYRQRSQAHAQYYEAGNGAAQNTSNVSGNNNNNNNNNKTVSANGSSANMQQQLHQLLSSRAPSSSAHTAAPSSSATSAPPQHAPQPPQPHYNPYDFAYRTQLHLARVAAGTLNSKIRAGAATTATAANGVDETGASVGAAAAMAAANAYNQQANLPASPIFGGASNSNIAAAAGDPLLERQVTSASDIGPFSGHPSSTMASARSGIAAPRSVSGDGTAVPITAAAVGFDPTSASAAAAATAAANAAGTGTLWFDESLQTANANGRATAAGAAVAAADLSPITLVHLQRLLLQKLNELIRVAHVAASLGIVGKCGLPAYLKPMLFGAGIAGFERLHGGANSTVAGGSNSVGGIVNANGSVPLGGSPMMMAARPASAGALVSGAPSSVALLGGPTAGSAHHSTRALARKASSRGGFHGGGGAAATPSSPSAKLQGAPPLSLAALSGGGGGSNSGQQWNPTLPPIGAGGIVAGAAQVPPRHSNGGVCHAVALSEPVLIPYPLTPAAAEAALAGAGISGGAHNTNGGGAVNRSRRTSSVLDTSAASEGDDTFGESAAIEASGRVAFPALAVDASAVVRRCQYTVRDVMNTTDFFPALLNSNGNGNGGNAAATVPTSYSSGTSATAALSMPRGPTGHRLTLPPTYGGFGGAFGHPPVDATVPIASAVTDAVMVYHSVVATPKQPDAMFADDEIFAAAAAAGVVLPSAMLATQQRKAAAAAAAAAAQQQQQSLSGPFGASSTAQNRHFASGAAIGKGAKNGGGITLLPNNSSGDAASSPLRMEAVSTTATATTSLMVRPGTGGSTSSAGGGGRQRRASSASPTAAVSRQQIQQQQQAVSGSRRAPSAGPSPSPLAKLGNISEYDKRTATASGSSSKKASPIPSQSGSSATTTELQRQLAERGGRILAAAGAESIRSNRPIGGGDGNGGGVSSDDDGEGCGDVSAMRLSRTGRRRDSNDCNEDESGKMYAHDGSDDGAGAEEDEHLGDPTLLGAADPDAELIPVMRRSTESEDDEKDGVNENDPADFSSDDEEEKAAMARHRRDMRDRTQRLIGTVPASSFMARTRKDVPSVAPELAATTGGTSTAQQHRFRITNLPMRAHLSKNPAIDALVKKGVLPPRPATTGGKSTAAGPRIGGYTEEGDISAAAGAGNNRRRTASSTTNGGGGGGASPAHLNDRSRLVSPLISNAAMADARTCVPNASNELPAVPPPGAGVLLAPLPPPRISLRPTERFEPPEAVQRSAMEKVISSSSSSGNNASGGQLALITDKKHSTTTNNVSGVAIMRAVSPAFSPEGGWHQSRRGLLEQQLQQQQQQRGRTKSASRIIGSGDDEYIHYGDDDDEEGQRANGNEMEDDVSWTVARGSSGKTKKRAAANVSSENDGLNDDSAVTPTDDNDTNGDAEPGGRGGALSFSPRSRNESASQLFSSRGGSARREASGSVGRKGVGASSSQIRKKGSNVASSSSTALVRASTPSVSPPSAAVGKEVFELKTKLHAAEVAVTELTAANRRLQQKLEIFHAVQDHLGAANEIGRFVELGSSVAAALLLQGLRHTGQSLRPPSEQIRQQQRAAATAAAAALAAAVSPSTTAATTLPAPATPPAPVVTVTSPAAVSAQPRSPSAASGRGGSPTTKRRMSVKGGASSPLGRKESHGASLLSAEGGGSSGADTPIGLLPPPPPPPTAPQLVHAFFTTMVGDLSRVCGGERVAVYPSVPLAAAGGGGATTPLPPSNNGTVTPRALGIAGATTAAASGAAGGDDPNEASHRSSAPPGSERGERQDPESQPSARAAAIFNQAFAASSAAGAPPLLSPGASLSPTPQAQPLQRRRSNLGLGLSATVGPSGGGNLQPLSASNSNNGTPSATPPPQHQQQQLQGILTAFMPKEARSVLAGGIGANGPNVPVGGLPAMPYLYPTQLLLDALMTECGVDKDNSETVGTSSFDSAVFAPPPHGQSHHPHSLSAASMQQQPFSSPLPTIDAVAKILNYSGGAFAGLLAAMPVGWVSNAVLTNASAHQKLLQRRGGADERGNLTSRSNASSTSLAGGRVLLESGVGGVGGGFDIILNDPLDATANGYGGKRGGLGRGGGNHSHAQSSAGTPSLGPLLSGGATAGGGVTIPPLPLSALTTSAEERFAMLEKLVVFGAHSYSDDRSGLGAGVGGTAVPIGAIPSLLQQQQQQQSVGGGFNGDNTNNNPLAISASAKDGGGGGLRRGSSSASMIAATARGTGQPHSSGSAAATAAAGVAFSTTDFEASSAPTTAAAAAGASTTSVGRKTTLTFVPSAGSAAAPNSASSAAAAAAAVQGYQQPPPKSGYINVEAIVASLQSALAATAAPSKKGGGGASSKQQAAASAAVVVPSTADASPSAKKSKKKGVNSAEMEALLAAEEAAALARQQRAAEEERIVRKVILEAVANQPHPLDCLSPRSVKLAKDIKDMLVALGGSADSVTSLAAARDGVTMSTTTAAGGGGNGPTTATTATAVGAAAVAPTASSLSVASLLGAGNAPSASAVKIASKTFVGLSAAQQEAKVAEWLGAYNSNPHLRNVVKVQNALIELLLTALLKEGRSAEMPLMGA